MKKKNEFRLAFLMPAPPMEGDVIVRSPEDVWKVCEPTSSYGAETFSVLCVNSKNRLIAGGHISMGILDTCPVHPREVFKAAILHSAAAIILCHNHPSGDPTPSAEDVRITRQLIQAGQVIGIKVLDHVIVGKPSVDRARAFVSLRESGTVEFVL